MRISSMMQGNKFGFRTKKKSHILISIDYFYFYGKKGAQRISLFSACY